jgi:hypothetical protein
LQKVNWALLDKVANEGERKRLQMENDELRVILKQYLNGISITPDSIQEDNPLVVVNSRSGIAIHQPVREGSATHSTHQPATLSVIPKLFDSLLGAVVSIMDANVLVREAARMRNK